MKTNQIQTCNEKKEDIISDMKKEGWIDENNNIEIYGEDAETKEEKMKLWNKFLRRYDVVLSDKTINDIENEFISKMNEKKENGGYKMSENEKKQYIRKSFQIVDDVISYMDLEYQKGRHGDQVINHINYIARSIYSDLEKML